MKDLRSIVCVALCSLVLACGDDKDSAPTTDGGGSSGGGDAVGGAGAGGGGADGGGDVGGQAPTPPLVTVTVRSYEGGPQAGVDLIVNDGEGSLLGQAVTGATGTAEVAIPAGASLSALYEINSDWVSPPSVQRRVDTMIFASAPPGAVAFNILVVSAPPEPPYPMTQLFTYPLRTGATSYQLITSCASKESTGNAILIDAPGCTSNNVFDAVIVARNAAGAIVDHAEWSNLEFMSGSSKSYAMTWSGAPLSMIPFVVSNIPSGSSISAATVARELEAGKATPIVRTHALVNAPQVTTFSLQHAAAYGSQHCQSVGIQIPSAGPIGSSYHRQRCSDVADVSPFLLDPERLTRFDVLAPAFDPLELGWRAAEEAETGDLLSAEQTWYRGEDDSGVWTVYLAPAERDIVFPQLPAGFAEFAIEGSDVLTGTKVKHLDYADLDSFNEALAHGVPAVAELSFETSYSFLLP